MTTPRRRPSTRPADAPLRVVLYTRVSSAEQADSGAGLAAQETALRAEATRRGWDVVAVFTDAGISGKAIASRQGVTDAVAMIERGEADALAASKLDRISRSVLDFFSLVERSRANGWRLIALDIAADPTTPQGEMMTGMMALFAQYERRLIGQRTKDALAEKRAQGIVLGRPRVYMDPATVARILTERRQGRSLPMIANGLTDDAVPTARGGARWYPSTVRDVLLRHTVAA